MWFPKPIGNEDQDRINLIAAEDVNLTERQNLLGSLKTSLDSSKWSRSWFLILIQRTIERREEFRKKIHDENLRRDSSGRLLFSGHYGQDLFTEVNRYALAADSIAKDLSFDIIHAHDWLTFPAGIAAKKASGKPLVIHVHATDFDRSGGKANPGVFRN